MRKLLCFTAAAALGATGAMAATGGRFAGSELLPLAKVSLAQARATATASRPGQITDQELEKESGGTGLRYSFDQKYVRIRNYDLGEVPGTPGFAYTVVQNGAHNFHAIADVELPHMRPNPSDCNTEINPRLFRFGQHSSCISEKGEQSK